MKGGKAVVTGDRSLACGHCAAVCPTGAVEVTALNEKTLDFRNFPLDRSWLPPGEFDAAALVRLMASRRSCRNFKDLPVDRSLLDDLVNAAVTAPSATNSQMWTFTVLSSREALLACGEGVVGFFRRLNRLAEKALLRNLLRMAGKRDLDTYYREYLETVKEAIEDWDLRRKDRLFHGATAAIVVGSRRGATSPREDAFLAAQNILLSAHALGLGSCLIGFAVEAMRRDRRIPRSLGIPDGETVQGFVALGYPDEAYRRIVGRKEFVKRYV
jgi:nitroreductase